MAFPTIKKCCCCSVKVGTLVLLYMGLFSGINNAFVKIFPELQDQPPVDNEDEKAFLGAYKCFQKWYEASRVPSAIMEIIVSVLGLYGVHKEKHLFLVPVLISYVSTLIGLALFSLMFFIAFLSYGNYGVALAFIVAVNIITAIVAFLTEVIYSHYHEIKEKKEQPWKSSYVV